MNTALWVFGAVTCNMVIGAGIWAAIDDQDKHLYRWYKECPPQIAWLAQPLVLMAWPIGLWMWWKNKRHNAQVTGAAPTNGKRSDDL